MVRSHWALRHRTTTCDGRSLGDRGPSRWMVMFKTWPLPTGTKPGCDARDLEYRTIIARRRATYLDVMRGRGCHICSHVLMWTAFSRCCSMVVRRLTTSYEIAQPSYDCNRVQTSASRQTIIVKSSDLVRLSCDGVLRCRTSSIHTSQTHLFRCDHKTKIVIS